MSRVTTHSKTTLVTSLTLRVTTASRNYWMLFNTFQNILLNARHNVNVDAHVGDYGYEKKSYLTFFIIGVIWVWLGALGRWHDVVLLPLRICLKWAPVTLVTPWKQHETKVRGVRQVGASLQCYHWCWPHFNQVPVVAMDVLTTSLSLHLKWQLVWQKAGNNVLTSKCTMSFGPIKILVHLCITGNGHMHPLT